MKVAVVGHVEWIEFLRVEAVPLPGEIVGDAGNLGGACRRRRRRSGRARAARRRHRRSTACLGGDDLGNAGPDGARGRIGAAFSRAKSDDAAAPRLRLHRRGRRADDHDHRRQAASRRRRGNAALGGARRRRRRLLHGRRRGGRPPGPACARPRGDRPRAADAPRGGRRAWTRSSRVGRTTPSATRPAISIRRRSWSCRRRVRSGGWAPAAAGRTRPPSRPAPYEDAYGAGDCFAAALTFALATGMEIPDALTFASERGARSRSRAAAPVSGAERRQPYLGRFGLEEACKPPALGRDRRKCALRQPVDVGDDQTTGSSRHLPLTTPSCSTEPQPSVPAGSERRAIGVTDEAAAVVVREQDVVVLGQEAHRRGRVVRGVWRARQVEELTAALVPEGDELRPKPLDDGAQSGQAAPRRQRRRPRPGRTPRGTAARPSRSTDPRTNGLPSHDSAVVDLTCALRPQSPRGGTCTNASSHLAGVREGGRVEIRKPLREDRAQLGPAPRLLREESPAQTRPPASGRRPEARVRVPGGVAAEPRETGCTSGAQQQTVVAGDEVDRPAHDADPHDVSALQQLRTATPAGSRRVETRDRCRGCAAPAPACRRGAPPLPTASARRARAGAVARAWPGSALVYSAPRPLVATHERELLARESR